MLMRQSRFRRSHKPCRLSLSIPYVTCLVYDCLYKFAITDVLFSPSCKIRTVPYRRPRKCTRATGLPWATPHRPSPRRVRGQQSLADTVAGERCVGYEQAITCDAMRLDCAIRSRRAHCMSRDSNSH